MTTSVTEMWAMRGAVGLFGRGLVEVAGMVAIEDAIATIRGRAASSIKGPEYAGWYCHDVPLLLEEIDNLRYMLRVASRDT